ncbi:MAG: hypothetical protein JWN44_3592 [Myxococcales bacterium]|nr:hypothetical protein [Myxococcales bacterium]
MSNKHILVAVLIAGCTGSPDADVASTSDPVRLVDPRAGTLLVNSSTAPSAITAPGYLTLSLSSPASNATQARFFCDGQPLSAALFQAPFWIGVPVDEAENGTHRYSASVVVGGATVASNDVWLTVSITGGVETITSTFASKPIAGSIAAVTTTSVGDLVAVGTGAPGSNTNPPTSMALFWARGFDGVSTFLDADTKRSSTWSAVASGLGNDVIVRAGSALVGGQRDAVISGLSRRTGAVNFDDKFHVEYDAAREDDEALGVAASNDATFVVVGYETRGGVRSGWATKYDTNGATRWTQRFQSTASEPWAIARAVAVGTDRSVYVAGQMETMISFGTHYGTLVPVRVPFLAKLAADGTLLSTRLDYSFFGEYESVSVANDGHVVVSGSAENNVAVVTALEANGAERWSTRLQNAYGQVRSSLDNRGAVYVHISAGPNAANTIGPPSTIAKLASDGRILWQRNSNVAGLAQTVDTRSSPEGYIVAGSNDGMWTLGTVTP